MYVCTYSTLTNYDTYNIEASVASSSRHNESEGIICTVPDLFKITKPREANSVS